MGDLFDHTSFFYLAMIVAGFLTGVQFSLIGRLAPVCGRDPGRAGGALECLDHVGACLGAFLTGVVLIPVSGIVATLAALMAVEFYAAASIMLSVFQLSRKPVSKTDLPRIPE